MLIKKTTNIPIVIPSDAIEAEKTAARELADYLKQVTGASLIVRTEAQVPADQPQILVGQSARVRKLLPDVQWSALGKDGIVIRTVNNAPRQQAARSSSLVLAGGRPRGSLYAVYTFLEDYAGCRWWTSTESTIPRKTELSIGNIDRVYTPKLLYREHFCRDINNNPLFAAKMRNNGNFSKIPDEYGGHYTIIGFVHTFYNWLPPAKYFGEHPEWYSLINGKRNTTNAQLCLTNKDCLDAMIKAVLEQIRKDPGAGIISVSQNDCWGPCQCENCKALAEKEGSEAGPLIHFVNQVAAAVEKEYPDFLIETLAYSYTRKPPKFAKPRKNVVVRLCSIECDFSKPLESESNKDFADDIRKWSAISPHLYIWNYVTDFSNYIQPHPNIRPYAQDLQFFVNNNAIGMFEQGDAYCSIGDFVRMRAWVISHLMWDPALAPDGISRTPSATEDHLIDEFLNGYYGRAGAYLRRYLDLLDQSYTQTKGRLTCYNKSLSFLTLDVMNQATKLWDHAEAAVKNDPTLLTRVQRDRLSFNHAWLLRYKQLKMQAKRSGGEFSGPADPVAAAEDFIEAAKSWDVTNFSEGQGFESYIPELRTQVGPTALPEDLAAKKDSVRVGPSFFRLANPGQWVYIVDDTQAAGGKAAKMPGSHTQWAVQWPVPSELDEMGGQWHCYVDVRVEPKAKTGLALACGIYDTERAVSEAFTDRRLEQITGTGYQRIDLGVHKLNNDMYLWIAPPGDADAVDALYVDAFVLEKAK